MLFLVFPKEIITSMNKNERSKDLESVELFYYPGFSLKVIGLGIVLQIVIYTFNYFVFGWLGLLRTKPLYYIVCRLSYVLIRRGWASSITWLVSIYFVWPCMHPSLLLFAVIIWRWCQIYICVYVLQHYLATLHLPTKHVHRILDNNPQSFCPEKLLRCFFLSTPNLHISIALQGRWILLNLTFSIVITMSYALSALLLLSHQQLCFIL